MGMHNQVRKLKTQRGWSSDPRVICSQIPESVRKQWTQWTPWVPAPFCSLASELLGSSLDLIFDATNCQKFRNYANKTNASQKSVINKSILCRYQKELVKLGSLKANETYGYIAIKQLIQWGSSGCLLFTVVGYYIQIFLNDRELGSGYLLSILGKFVLFMTTGGTCKRWCRSSQTCKNKLN